MIVNDDPNIVVLHREMYDELIGSVPPNERRAIRKVIKHARKFNANLKEERAKQIDEETKRQKFLKKKRQLLLQWHKRMAADGQRIVIWHYGYSLMPYFFKGIDRNNNVIVHAYKPPGIQRLNVSLTKILPLEYTFVDYSDEVDSYSTGIISAALNLGLLDIKPRFEPLPNHDGTVKVCKELGLIIVPDDERPPGVGTCPTNHS